MTANSVIDPYLKALICNFEENADILDLPTNIQDLWRCDWRSVINGTLLEHLLTNNLTIDKSFCEYQEAKLSALCVAAACLLSYTQINFTGPDLGNIEDVIGSRWPEHIEAALILSVDSVDLNVNATLPELLLLASTILNSLKEYYDDKSAINPIAILWHLRCLMIHQRSLDEFSHTIYTKVNDCVERLNDFRIQLSQSPSIADRRLSVLLNIEICQAYLYYTRVNKAKEYLEAASTISGLTLNVSGILGKRTQYQQDNVAQLYLEVKLGDDGSSDNAKESHSGPLPQLLKMNDDLRLEKVQYNEETEHVDIPSLDQLVVLNTLVYKRRSQPTDNLLDEELQPYIQTLLAQSHGPWSVRMQTLLILLNLECNNKRTVERSMMQCEEVVALQSINDPKVFSRLSYIFSSGLLTRWQSRSQLADLLRSIGLVKAALDIYLKLQLWEDVIVCYTILELRHKAAEVIKEQIALKPTVKLYCLLGDATDDISCYERAWEMSNEKSSKPQRHWGNYLFARKQYEEAIPHYEKSLEINSLQELVWLRLGYAALTIENWSVAAIAYRRYTNLEAHGFESWNNLAKAYIKLGEKDRAHKILLEALKCNYDNWQVWENMMVVSVDTGNFSDAIRAYDRLVDLRGKHLDLEVLQILANAIMGKKIDADGNSAYRLLDRYQKLIARLCTIYMGESALWQIYASLPMKTISKAHKLLKAYHALTLGNWSTHPDICEQVVLLCFDLASTTIEAVNETDRNNVADSTQMFQQLSSARLSCQAAYAAASKSNSNWPKVSPLLPELKEQVDVLTELTKQWLK